MDETLLLIVLAVLVNGLIDCTLVAWLAGRRSKKALQEWLMSGDEEMQAMVSKIIALALVTPIRTGKKVADDDGKESFEELPLFKFVGRELSQSLLYRLKASRGGTKTAAGEAIMDELGPGLLGLGGPRKGQSTFDYALEQMIPRAMPTIEKKLAEMLEKKSY